MSEAVNLREIPGITLGLPFAKYLALPGLSASKLKHLMISPRNYRWNEDHPNLTVSGSMALGTAAHTAILEPERFVDLYKVYEGTRRGKAWEAFQEENCYSEILTASEYADVCGMRDAIRSHPAAARYLQNGVAEVTIQWVDPSSGRAFKGRVDWVTVVDGRLTLVDLKTTRDSSPRKFGADAYRLGYHIQFGLYVDGWYHLTKETPRFVVLAVESKGPFEPAAFDVPEDVLMQGHEEYMGLLTQLKECEDSNTWPPRIQEEIPLTLPSWAVSDDDDLSDIGLDLSA